MKNLLTFVAILILALGLAPRATAQDQSEVADAPFAKAPYRVGERLTYDISFSSFPSAAHVELWIAGFGTYFNRQGIQLRAHAETTGAVNAALFSFNSDYVAYVSPETGQPFRTQQFRREAGRTDDVSREYNKPAGTEAIPSKVREMGLAGTYDIASALYRLRALPLTEGSKYNFLLNANDIVYETELKVIGREVVKTNVGSFNALVTQLRFPRNSTANNLKVRIYFSDDDRHVPVLLTARHSAGEIRAELAGSELPGNTPALVDANDAEIATSQSQVQPAPNPGADPTSDIPGIPSMPTSPVPTAPPTPNPSKFPNGDSPNVAPPVKPKAGPMTPRLTDPGTNSTTLPAGLPFAAGEQLNFNIFLENVAAPVGLASFQVRSRSKYFGRDGLMLTGRAQTIGTAQTLLSANDQITTYVDPNTLLPFRYDMTLQESRRKVNQSVVFDQDRGNATIEAGVRIDIPVGTYDLLSVFYALRSFNLKSSKPNAVSLLVNNRARTLFITFLKRETIDLGGQQIPALQLSLTTDDAQPDRNGLRLWVSEDQRRLPLRFTAGTTSGRVSADLAILPIVRQ